MDGRLVTFAFDPNMVLGHLHENMVVKSLDPLILRGDHSPMDHFTLVERVLDRDDTSTKGTDVRV